jgi:predicted nucleic acid-binding protein
MAWPLRIAQVRGLLLTRGGSAPTVTFADALYVALADHLGADLLCYDRRLTNAPGLPVRVLRLP